MEEQLVRFKTAKIARDKGFNIHCIECYMPNGEETLDLDKRLSKDNRIYAPTQSLLQKWLREEKDILVYVDPKSHHFFQSHIITQDNEIIGDRGDNWEDVLEDGLYIALQEI